MSAPTWRAVAVLLADRLASHEFCDDHGAIADGLARGCPFCQDREAMRIYRAKSGERPMEVVGVLVPVHEIKTESGDPS